LDKVFCEAEDWIKSFVNWYNNEHRHSEIKYVTPEQRHSGKDKDILSKREKTYTIAKEKHPERWSGKIRNWDWIEFVYLNPTKEEVALTKKTG